MRKSVEPWQDKVVSWHKLRSALDSGARGYQAARVSTDQSNQAVNSRAFKSKRSAHGKAGTARADALCNVLDACSDVKQESDKGHIALLALAMALFEPRQTFMQSLFKGPSQWLAACVAHHMMSGSDSRRYYGLTASDDTMNEKKGLRTDVFSQATLDSARDKFESNDVSADGWETDYVGCARVMLRSVRNAILKESEAAQLYDSQFTLFNDILSGKAKQIDVEHGVAMDMK